VDNLILEQRDGSIVTLTLNAPERRNPISDLAMIDALEAAIKASDADVSVRVIILTGAGTAFSSGGDIRRMAPGLGLRDDLPVQTRRNYRDGIQRLPLLFESIDVPVIAAVNGPAIGAGCDLACMCDIRIASETALFAESFVKVGLVPGDGGAWLLPRIVGFSRAVQLALTGETINARQALEYGLVSRVSGNDVLLYEAHIIAEQIAANPPHAVRLTKRLLREAQNNSLQAVLELSAAMQALVHATGDHDEAVAAFIERRSPHYTGR
jgi:enoyl-CoA hydratase/carnithine racemase